MSQPSQMQVYIKKWRPSTYTIEPCDEVILSDATPKHLKQQVNSYYCWGICGVVFVSISCTAFFQISKKAGFPAERVEFAKGIGSFPCDVSPLEIQENLDWNPRITSINAWPLSLYVTWSD